MHDIYLRTMYRLSKGRIGDLRETVWVVENTGVLSFDKHGNRCDRGDAKRPANKLAQEQINLIEEVVDNLTRPEPEATGSGATYRICKRHRATLTQATRSCL